MDVVSIRLILYRVPVTASLLRTPLHAREHSQRLSGNSVISYQKDILEPQSQVSQHAGRSKK